VEIARQIQDFIVAELGDSATKLTTRDDLLESGFLDSAGLAQLVSYIEEQFDVEIEDEELVHENFRTIDAIVELIESKTEATPLAG
jgi:acyl carrier protein